MGRNYAPLLVDGGRRNGSGVTRRILRHGRRDGRDGIFAADATSGVGYFVVGEGHEGSGRSESVFGDGFEGVSEEGVVVANDVVVVVVVVVVMIAEGYSFGRG